MSTEPEDQPPRTEIARFASFTEGVVVGLEGEVYVSHGDCISQVSPDRRVRLWGRTASPNGHKILPDGTHLVCDRSGYLLQLDADGRILKTVAEAEHAANDLCLDPNHGGFYFTSPYGSELEAVGRIYYVDDRGRARVAADSLRFPNGVVLSRDGTMLLAALSAVNQIVAFKVREPGVLGPPELFAEMPGAERFDPNRFLDGPLPDGLALDVEQNLYVANYGAGAVQVFDAGGRLLRTLASGGRFTSNLAFGGAEMNVLYLSGSIGPVKDTPGFLMRLEMPGIRGVRLVRRQSEEAL
jgi:gluconolactonase